MMNRFLFIFSLRQGCFFMSVVYGIIRVKTLITDTIITIWPPEYNSSPPSKEVDLVFTLLWDVYFFMLVVMIFFGALLQNSWLVFTYSSLSYYRIVMMTTFRLFLFVESQNKVKIFFMNFSELVMDMYFLFTSYNYYTQLKETDSSILIPATS